MTFKQKYYLRLFYYRFDYNLILILLCSILLIGIFCICYLTDYKSNVTPDGIVELSIIYNGKINNLYVPFIIFIMTFIIIAIISKYNIKKYKYIDNFDRIDDFINDDLKAITFNTFKRILYEDGMYYYFINDRLITTAKFYNDSYNLSLHHNIYSLKDLEKFPIYKTRTQIQENRDIKIDKLLKI